MTQIQDLRIGNLVYDSHREGEIQTIESIKQTKFFGAFVGFTTIRGNFVEVDSDRINGIPLTEKILLDSGFETRGFTFSFEIEKGKYFNVLLGDIENWFALHIADIDYYIPCHNTKHVHDLQNAFYMVLEQQLNIVIK